MIPVHRMPQALPGMQNEEKLASESVWINSKSANKTDEQLRTLIQNMSVRTVYFQECAMSNVTLKILIEVLEKNKVINSWLIDLNSDLKGITRLFAALAANQTIEDLTFISPSYTLPPFTIEVATGLKQFLSQNTTVHSLYFGGAYEMDAEECFRILQALISGLKNNKTLNTFALADLRKISENDFKEFIVVLQAHPALFSVQFLELNVSQVVARALASLLHVNTTITDFTLREASVFLYAEEDDPPSVELVARSLDSMQPLLKALTIAQHPCISLDIGVHLFSDNLRSVSNMLACNRTLQSLDLFGCNIKPDALSVLIDGLNHNENTLTRLNLYKNPLGAEGERMLSEWLTSDKTALTSLNVSRCGFDSEAMSRFLKRVLHENKILTELDISNNIVDDKVACVLAGGLSFNTTLAVLAISSYASMTVCIDEDEESSILNITLPSYSVDDNAGPPSFESIFVQKNRFPKCKFNLSERGLSVLSVAIDVNKTLTEFRWKMESNMHASSHTQRISSLIETSLQRNQQIQSRVARNFSAVALLIATRRAVVKVPRTETEPESYWPESGLFGALFSLIPHILHIADLGARNKNAVFPMSTVEKVLYPSPSNKEWTPQYNRGVSSSVQEMAVVPSSSKKRRRGEPLI